MIFGGGPSLTMDQVEKVREAHQRGRCRGIAINDAYLVAPWADVLYAADRLWWLAHAAGVAKPLLGLSADQARERFSAFPGERCSIQGTGKNADEPIHLLRNRDHPCYSVGLSLDPGALVTGRHGGWQALNLAVLAGAKVGILLGIDGRPSPEGKTHWHGGHARATPAASYGQYRQAWSAGEDALKAAGVSVLNASPGSAIESFPKVNLAEALA
ncbi:MAG: hypothetical protein HY661_07560 [Betaproteobacteria bacterium]|nr:hypothetical protein [Betaproteobacteria bacterium]